MKAILLTIILLVPTLVMAYSYTDSYGAGTGLNQFAGQDTAYTTQAMNYGRQNGVVGTAANAAGNTINTAGNIAGNAVSTAGNVAANTVGAVASIF